MLKVGDVVTSKHKPSIMGIILEIENYAFSSNRYICWVRLMNGHLGAHYMNNLVPAKDITNSTSFKREQ